jgi:predicted SprT family Zn-dependent metalloprotease
MPAMSRPLDSLLVPVFDVLNETHFDGFLDPVVLRWNTRLRSSAGRFIPGSVRWRLPAVIEIATYLNDEPNAQELVSDTLGHEMIHYWLWLRRKPYGHTPEFWAKMTQMGVSRWNPVPRTRPYKYVYRCLACSGEFPARRRLGTLACARCCRRHTHGRYDARFKLVLERSLAKGETYVRAQPPAV